MSESNELQCAPLGHVSWNELMTQDVAASGEFYGKLFGWKVRPFSAPGGGAGETPYFLFHQEGDEKEIGGMMQTHGPDMPSRWVPYVMVADADTTLARAVALGATVCLPVTPVQGVGRIAVLCDQQGVVIGLHEPPKA